MFELGCGVQAQQPLLGEAESRLRRRPLGSAAETAIPATIMLSKTLVHSSGVKFPYRGLKSDASGRAVHASRNVGLGSVADITALIKQVRLVPLADIPQRSLAEETVEESHLFQ